MPVPPTLHRRRQGRKLSEARDSGSLSLTNSFAYDLAGRLTNQTDGAGLVTSYSYSDSGRTTTVTLPGGATRVTRRYKDGRTKSVTGTGVVAKYYDYGVNDDGTRWTKVSTGASNSTMWVKSTADVLGRTIAEERPAPGGGTATNAYAYNAKGQLIETTTPGSGATWYEYDEIGNRTRTILDADGSGTTNGTDRITKVDSRYEETASDWWKVTSSGVYATDGSEAVTTNSIRKMRLTGRSASLTAQSVAIDVHGNEITNSTAVVRASKRVTQTVSYPDSSNDGATVTVNGLVQTSEGKTGHQVSYTYDGLGRRTGVQDPRTGTATTSYNSEGQVEHAVDAAGNTNSYAYDASTGRRSSVTDALGEKVYYEYDSTGQLARTWGDKVYPVSYAYDGYGRMTGMTTYRGGSGWTGSSWPSASTGTGDTTSWLYDEATGLLTNKTYADGEGTTYGYAGDGKLSTRTWARGATTTYTYDPYAGDLTNIAYSGSSTTNISFTYDRLGRRKTVADAAGTRTFTYNSVLQLASETMSGLYSRTISRNYDTAAGTRGRSTGFSQGSSHDVEYGYDALGRFNSLTWSNALSGAARTATYSYLANSDLLSGLDETNSGFSLSRTFETSRNLITQVKTEMGADVVSQYDYISDAVGRRTSVKNSGDAFTAVTNTADLSAFNLYGYNDRGELTAAERFFGTNISQTNDPVSGQSWQYAYDNIGNRSSATRSGDQDSYAANELNQYTSRVVTGIAHVLGAASTQATVTVNSQATTRQGAYFHKGLSVTNTSDPVYQQVVVVGVVNDAGTNGEDAVTSITGHVYVAETPESFSHDDDGNLLSDGRWDYTWNGENRLVGMETLSAVTNSGVPPLKLAFAYDYMGRRVRKEVCYSYTNGAYSGTNVTLFVYDGWNLVEEIADSSTNYYAWGLDLSGSLQGAGGIGGLVAADGIGSNTVLYAYDANGNVGQLVDVSDGSLAAHYEPDPFGALVVSAGNYAYDNPFRFSTKFQDDETGLLYYGFRYLSPGTGKWVSRDPLCDPAWRTVMRGGGGGLSRTLAASPACMRGLPYAFVDNNPQAGSDALGLVLDTWLTWWQKAGNDCCPACELDALRDAKRTAEGILDNLRRDPPDLPADYRSNLRTVAGGRCRQSVPGDGSKPGKWNQKKMPDVKTCKGWCTLIHETIHKNQCEGNAYDAFDWVLYGQDSYVTASIERPAYEATVRCLGALIKWAEKDIAKYGTAEEACKCCPVD